MNNQTSFMDGKTWLAIGMVMAFWLGWQMYMAKKYPDAKSVTGKAAQEAATAPQAAAPKAQEAATPPSSASAATLSPAVEAQKLKFEDKTWAFEISSRGMSVTNVTLKQFSSRDGKPVVFGEGLSSGVFQTGIAGDQNDLDFVISAEGSVFRGVAKRGGVTIEKVITAEPARYLFRVELKIQGLDGTLRGIRSTMSEAVLPHEGSMLNPSTEIQNLYVAHGTTSFRETLDAEGAGRLAANEPNVSVVSLGSLYFARAIVDHSDIHPSYSGFYTDTEGPNGTATAELEYLFPSGLPHANLKYDVFVGPKELSLLNSIDPKLEGIIDYWVVGALAKPMLSLMKWFHTILGNWGLAIILLTVVVRLLVLPLYLSSFKSMKAMQKVQPQMQSLRERYKDNPQQLNAEVMKLFRENKVNPVGGCLPMLLQLPIFIALYRVLSQSIELYQAPFALWIHDLSIKDPFYVLPILMGASMFIQQKITPMTTADPAQQKVMLFMPVIFSLMMISLPSGLTLYIFVSTVFGIVQQMIFMKDKTPKTVTARA